MKHFANEYSAGFGREAVELILANLKGAGWDCAYGDQPRAPSSGEEADRWLDERDRFWHAFEATAARLCECGKALGRWPYPIGGGIALACHACRAESESSDGGFTSAEWDAFDRDLNKGGK
jgi:hypothetical protein